MNAGSAAGAPGDGRLGRDHFGLRWERARVRLRGDPRGWVRGFLVPGAATVAGHPPAARLDRNLR